MDISHVITDWPTARDAMSRAPTIALDLETSGLKPWSDQVAVVSMADGEGNTAVLHTRGKLPEGLTEWLRTKEWLTQNGTQFDNIFMYRYYEPEFKPAAYDLRLAEAVVDTGFRRRSYSLGALMLHHLGANLKQDMDHSSWMNPELNEDQIFYCAADVDSLHKIRASQTSKLRRPWPGTMLHVGDPGKPAEAVSLENQLGVVTSRMIYNGIPLNMEALEGARVTQADRIEKLTAHFPPGFNPNSSQQVKVLLDSQGTPVKDTRENTLLRLGTPVAIAITELRKNAKRLSMFSPAWVSKYVCGCGRVHALYNQMGAGTGRFTCKDPNMQQVPQNMRYVFQQEGHTMVSFDFSQLEVRIAAVLYKDPLLKDAILHTDFHATNLKHCLPVVPEGSRALSDRSWEDLDEQEFDDCRQYAKRVTFAYLFGGGPVAAMWTADEIMGRLKIKGDSDSYMRRLFSNLESAYPVTTALFNRMRTIARSAQDLQSPIIQHLPYGYTRTYLPGEAKATQLINSMAQGGAAVGLKKCLINLPPATLPYLCGAVHDELVFCIPDALVQDMVPVIMQTMEATLEEAFPGMEFPANSNVGKEWQH